MRKCDLCKNYCDDYNELAIVEPMNKHAWFFKVCLQCFEFGEWAKFLAVLGIEYKW